MNAIERVDVTGRTMRVQSGAILQRVQEEAERHDLMFALDLGGRGTCTIGGNISTNAGGVRVLRYGMMRALVLGIEAVLADGTVLKSLNRMIKNNAGYDLKQLFIGSEGTLGVVTRAELRLFRAPAQHQHRAGRLPGLRGPGETAGPARCEPRWPAECLRGDVAGILLWRRPAPLATIARCCPRAMASTVWWRPRGPTSKATPCASRRPWVRPWSRVWCWMPSSPNPSPSATPSGRRAMIRGSSPSTTAPR